VKAPQIIKLTFATISGGAFALALGLPAAAQAAPSGIGSAQDAVNELEHNGFQVVLNKMGAAPLRSLHGRLCATAVRWSSVSSKTAPSR